MSVGKNQQQQTELNVITIPPCQLIATTNVKCTTNNVNNNLAVSNMMNTTLTNSDLSLATPKKTSNVTCPNAPKKTKPNRSVFDKPVGISKPSKTTSGLLSSLKLITRTTSTSVVHGAFKREVCRVLQFEDGETAADEGQ
ncbi:hypothetical protein ABK040_011513 [Willaertia magna]